MTTLVDSTRFLPTTPKEHGNLAELILLLILGGIVMTITLGSLIIDDPFYYIGGLVLLVLTIALFVVKLINALIDLKDRLKKT